ncbi:MAG: curli production assembly/transport component CsgG [Pyrinomonadaceae bacterium]|nr:curli production assembly/transport component CsgG [Pyrinomonadaceae bacterium]
MLAEIETGKPGVLPAVSFPVTDNETPYSACLRSLAPITTMPDGRVISVKPRVALAEILDKTGQYEQEGLSRPLSQGVTEMLYSALHKTRKVSLVERTDMRIPLAEMKLSEQNALVGRTQQAYQMTPTDFVIMGSLTELNYNIVSNGIGLNVRGIGASSRTAVVNVALDLRVVNSVTLDVPYAFSLQKQIVGVEVEASVFRFFGDTLVGFEAGGIKNEPLQLGVRSVAEMAAYQILTDFLRLPSSEECGLVEAKFYNKA